MGLVYIAACESYERDVVRRATRECLEGLDGALDQIAGRNVLLKPNLLSSTASPEKPANTHYEVTRAVAEYLIREQGCYVTLGDSCGTVASGATERAMENSGIRKIADELGCAAINFDTCSASSVKLPEGAFSDRIHIANPVLEADAIINLPKFKTHQLTLFTGAIKNMLGVIPGRGKKLVHAAAPKPAMMAHALVDIFERVIPTINIMDAVVGMEGRGPNSGDPKELKALLASTDPVALDSVCASIIGVDPLDVKTTRFAAERGLGVSDLDNIEIHGVTLEKITPDEFQLPSGYKNLWLLNLVPDRMARWAAGQHASYQSKVDTDRCTLCGQCVANCPVKRLYIDDRKVVADETPCIACYCCEEVCDYDAIHIVRSPLIVKLRSVKRILKLKRDKNGGERGG